MIKFEIWIGFYEVEMGFDFDKRLVLLINGIWFFDEIYMNGFCFFVGDG